MLQPALTRVDEFIEPEMPVVAPIKFLLLNALAFEPFPSKEVL